MHYYVNVVHERFPVAHIIQEAPPPRHAAPPSFFRRALASGARLVAKDSQDALDQKTRRQRDEILGARVAGFPSGVPIMRVEDINSPAVRDFLRAERPDAILVQGTSIVRDATLPDGVFNFNVHAGLSPYYRGGSCIAWALVNWDPYNIGVTLHRLTERADAGPIIAQRRVVPSENDTSRSISYKLTKEGAALALAVLERVATGGGVEHYPQDVSVGHCYAAGHLHPEMRALVDRIDRDGLIADMLRVPSTRVKRPIVEWSA